MIIAMIISISPQCFAKDISTKQETKEEITESLLGNYISDQPNITLFSDSDAATYALGDMIPAYELQGENLVTFGNANYYPVYYGDSIYGIMIINSPNQADYTTYSFAKEFADKLNQLIADGYKDYCIVVDNNKLYLKDGSKVDLLVEYPNSSNEEFKISSNQIDNTTIISGIDDDNIKYNVNSVQSILSPAITNIRSFAASTVTNSVPIWNQYGLNICWAGTVWCIGSYRTGSTAYDPGDVARSVFGSDWNKGAQNDEAQEAFSNCYGIQTTLINSTLSDSSIQSYIGQGKPLFMDWQSPSYGHAMTLRGYSIGNNMQISVMDTNGGQYKWFYKTGSNYSYVNGETYIWDATIVY